MATHPVSASETASYGDVTDQIELLGNPYEHLYPDYHPEMIYARNIWDMQAFDGRIYVGAGNSANSGPAVNAGPLPIMYLDPQTRLFATELVVDDEQIDLYQIIDGRLVIPGHDPTESWKWGNFYRLEDDGWKKYRNIPNGIHNYSMISHDGRFFAGLGTEDGAAVAVSEDDGESWVNHPAPGNPRVYALFRCQDQLFSAGMFVQWDEANLERLEPEQRNDLLERYGAAMAEWRHGEWIHRPDLTIPIMFPAPVEDGWGQIFAKIVKPADFNGTPVYIGGRVHNGHQFLPLGLFAAESLAEGKVRVNHLTAVSDSGEPWDLFVRDDHLFVLTAHRQANGTYRVAVLQTPDLANWTEVLHFDAPTFARSFETLDGAFFFGLGCEVENPRDWREEKLVKETGQILVFNPHQPQENRVLGNLRLPEPFISYLISLSKHTEPERRELAHLILREFVIQHDPNDPLDRSGFLQRMEELYEQADSCEEQAAAFRMLVLHSPQLDPKTKDRLLTEGFTHACDTVTKLASLTELSGLQTQASREFVRDFQGLRSPDLENVVFSEAVNRPSPAFPGNGSAEDFEQVEAIELPKDGWRFRKDLGVASGYLEEWFAPDHDISDWEQVRIGDFWASFLGDLYLGVGWYRLEWEAPAMEGYDALGLHFEGVDENAWVWVNGQYAGQHNIGMHGWDQPFQLDVTELLRPGETNQITVRVKNTRANGGIWQPVELRAYRKN